MNEATLRGLIDALQQHDRELADHATALREQVALLMAQAQEADRQRDELATTIKTLNNTAQRLTRPPAPRLPDHPAYQQIIDAFTAQQRPLRSRDLCQALDLPILPKHIEGIRAKLKRLTDLGFLEQTEPGLFTHRGLQPAEPHDDQQP